MSPMKTRLLSIGLALATAFTIAACSKDNPAAPQSNPLAGTWVLTAISGADVTGAGDYWVVTNDKATYFDADGCTTTMTYTTTGSKLITTTLTDQCFGDPAGTRDSVTYSLAGNVLTFTSGTSTLTYKRGAAQTQLAGTWRIQSVDGQPIPVGTTKTMTFQNMKIAIVTNTQGVGSCQTNFDYARLGNQIQAVATSDDCGFVEIGNQDDLRYVINGNTLTITFADNSQMVLQRQ